MHTEDKAYFIQKLSSSFHDRYAPLALYNSFIEIKSSLQNLIASVKKINEEAWSFCILNIKKS